MGRTVIIHDLDHARSALRAAADLGVRVRLRSAFGAAAYLGALAFREIIAAARTDFPAVGYEAVLDCGEDVGEALAALRHGIKCIRVNLRNDVRAKVVDIAEQVGATLDEDQSPALDLLDCEAPVQACRNWLAGDEGGAAEN
ncbi:MAG: hypothetical protein KIT00_09800 [Rhodospirillales bacterium]|nr:hypothetical protein [Rhodospirillales bacterium]